MTTYKDTMLLEDKVTATLKKIQEKAEQVQKSTEKVTKSTEKLNKKYNALQRGMRNVEAGLIKFDRKLRDTGNQLDKLKKRTEHIEKLGEKIKGIGQGLTVGVTLPVIAMGGAMVKAAADMEAMQTQLSTMLGSTEKGAQMFTKIQKMAAKTPFDASDLMEVTNVMLGFGQAEEKVLPLMQELGDISGGNKDKFKSLALAFSQASSVGKLQGQDWLQMVNAGFNPLEAMSKRTKKSIAQLKDDMSKGKISIAMVEQAMKDVTSEGGRFYKMMEKQSQTGLGQWSTFMGQINLTLASFGQVILPYAIKGMQKLSEWIEKFNSLSPGAKKTILIIAGIAAAIGPLLLVVGSAIGAILQINTALGLLAGVLNISKLAILGWGAAWGIAIVAIIAVIALLIIKWDKVKEVAVKVGKAIADTWNSLVGKFKNWIGTIMGWVDNLLEKLGLLAYFIPRLNTIKLAKDISGAIGNRTSNDNRQFNSNDNRSNFGNTYNTTNNYNSMFPFLNSQYAT